MRWNLRSHHVRSRFSTKSHGLPRGSPRSPPRIERSPGKVATFSGDSALARSKTRHFANRTLEERLKRLDSLVCFLEEPFRQAAPAAGRVVKTLQSAVTPARRPDEVLKRALRGFGPVVSPHWAFTTSRAADERALLPGAPGPLGRASGAALRRKPEDRPRQGEEVGNPTPHPLR